MKIVKYLMTLAAAAGMMAACQELEQVNFDPSTGETPVLNAVDDIIITDKNISTDKASFSWSKVSFELNVQVSYALIASVEGFDSVELATDMTETSISLDYSDLNDVFYNKMMLSNLQTYDATFTVAAYVGESERLVSEAVAAKVKVIASEKKYPAYFVVGSYNGWSHGNDQQEYLFDFAEDGASFQGVIDFGENHSANEFKFTQGDWGKGEHSMSGAHDAEAETVTLVSGGGDNINVYKADRYYHLTFSPGALSLKKNLSFNEMKIEGSAVPGGSMQMELKASNQKFWVDAELSAGTLKFTTDKSADNIAGEGEITVEAGKYRVYLNMNNLSDVTYELSTRDFGAVDNPEPEPEPTPDVWGIIGAAVGSWDNDVVMENDGTYWVAKNVTFAADEFKFRMNADWTSNFGGASFVANEEVVLVFNGGNIKAEAGTYDVYLDAENGKAWFINDGSYPGNAVPVMIFCESTGWDVTNLYGWGGALSLSWPGVPAEGTATISGKEYSYWTLDAKNFGAENVGLIFNNGSQQTVDITPVTLDGHKFFKVTEAGADGKLGYEALENPSIRITYKNESGWESVSMYGWGDLGDFGGWPGAAMTKDGDVWVYEVSVDNFGKSTSLIFNNAGAGAQTVDLGPFTLTGDLAFDNSNAQIK